MMAAATPSKLGACIGNELTLPKPKLVVVPVQQSYLALSGRGTLYVDWAYRMERA